MVDYSAEIAALQTSIATGTTEVRYADGRYVRFDSLEKLLERIRYLERLQNAGSQTSRLPTAGFAYFDRGDR